MARVAKYITLDYDGNETGWVWYDIDKSNVDDWYIDYFFHREDGPAYKSDSELSWWIDDCLHRYDGPARIEPTPGGDREEWFIHNYPIEKDDYLTWLEERGMDINDLTPEDKAMIDLKWKK